MKTLLNYLILIPAFPAVYFWGYCEGRNAEERLHQWVPESSTMHAVWVEPGPEVLSDPKVIWF